MKPDRHPFHEEDLEFSEYGRDPRFLPGWWLAPVFILGMLFVGPMLYFVFKGLVWMLWLILMAW